MTAKNVNKATNVAGIIFFFLAIYEIFNDKDIKFILLYLLVFIIGISVKNAMILRLLNKYLNNKISK